MLKAYHRTTRLSPYLYLIAFSIVCPNLIFKLNVSALTLIQLHPKNAVDFYEGSTL